MRLLMDEMLVQTTQHLIAGLDPLNLIVYDIYTIYIYINCLKVRAHFLSWYLKYLIFVTVWYYIECESVVCVCFGFSICSTYDKII